MPGRSDDSSFLDERVPAVNFFTGFHADYHRPTDDWDKIDKEGTARVAALALDPSEWTAVIAEVRARDAVGPDGEEAVLHDSVVLLRRAPA